MRMTSKISQCFLALVVGGMVMAFEARAQEGLSIEPEESAIKVSDENGVVSEGMDSGEYAIVPEDGDRNPADSNTRRNRARNQKPTKLPAKKLSVENEDNETPVETEQATNAPARRRSGGADSQEGWIIRRTKDGIIKIPKKETFRFEGGEVSGSAQRPAQTVLGTRPQANRYSLLPERKNYRSDILGSAGAGAVMGAPTSGLK